MTAGNFAFTNKNTVYSMNNLNIASWSAVRTCAAPNNPIAITTSNTAAVVHFINNGSYYFNVSQSFTGDELCDDYFRTYTTSLHPTTPQPMTYDSTNWQVSGLQASLFTSLNYIYAKVTIPTTVFGEFNKSVQFVDCATLTITASGT